MKNDMRDFDEIAELWRKQSPAPDGAERARQVESEIRLAVTRRQRKVTWGGGLVVLTLVAFRVVGTANLIASPTGPVPMTLVDFVLFQVVYTALLLYFAHRLVVGRDLQQTSGTSLRENLDRALEVTKATMRDFRVGAWLDPLLFVLIPLLSIANAQLTDAVSITSLFAWMVPLVVSHIVVWIFAWRHYHTVLCSERAQLTSLLAEIAAETA